ncbi:MAG: thioredoxin family protein [Solirubrobacterales bacterium]|nr:thioredoxin family protein [Solirubrobacterales bacterium]OJU93374.1 MAG: hypothetical protein BGO23_11940 [Solirubrobacterales bacterium 67-14]
MISGSVPAGWNPRRQLLVVAILVLLFAGCGRGAGDGYQAPSTPDPLEFPATEGQTLTEIAEPLPESEYVALPGQLVFERGQNRYAFGVFTLAKEMVSDAQVALYFAPGADGKAKGPYPADAEPLQTAPAFRSQTSAGTGGAPEVVYVVPEVNLARKGEWQILAVFKTDDGLQSTRMSSIVVGKFPGIPGAGDAAPKIHTQTPADVGGDMSKIDTRVPPDQMHNDDFAEVIGRKPVVLLFSTPAFCESRVCGPVVDIAEQVREEFKDEVAFIHQEVYNENDPTKGIRPELKAFNLASEPWLFVFDRNGNILSRIEGAFGADELRRAVESVRTQ